MRQRRHKRVPSVQSLTITPNRDLEALTLNASCKLLVPWPAARGEEFRHHCREYGTRTARVIEVRHEQGIPLKEPQRRDKSAEIVATMSLSGKCADESYG
jgi:hypothetical protein